MTKKYDLVLKTIYSMRRWQKIIIIDCDDEFLIERRKKSHTDKSYKWINPNVVIVDELMEHKHLF